MPAKKKLPKLLPLPKELTRSGAVVPSPRSGKPVVTSASGARTTKKRAVRTKVVSSGPTSRSSSGSSRDPDWLRVERIERNAVVDSVISKQAHPDTVVYKHLNAPPVSGSSGAVGKALATGAGFAAGSVALKAAGKAVKFLAGKTPAGRVVKGALAAYRIGRAVQAGRKLKALPAAVEIAKEVIF